MAADGMEGGAGSAALDLIDVAVAAASSNSVTVLKGRLLRAVAGVDRGVAATSSDMDAIEEAAQVTWRSCLGVSNARPLLARKKRRPTGRH